MRVIVILLDSLGVGALPDSIAYGDISVNTFGHIYNAHPNLKITNLKSLGFCNINNFDCIETPIGNFGKMAEISTGKDTTTGHWEIAGIETKVPFKTYPDGFPKDFIEEFQNRIGIEVIGNFPASGTEIIKELGPEHELTGKPIVYTSADSVFQIAMNVDLFGLDTLYHYCEIAREILVGDWACCRVIARPYIINENGVRVRTSDRKDYSVTPHSKTILNNIVDAGKKVIAIGKINDIFNGYGISESIHTVSNMDGVDKTIDVLKSNNNNCLIFTNLVEFDSKYGHRRNIDGYAQAIEDFDNRLPEIMASMKKDDILFLTADHGNDPTAPGTDHTREYVPLIVYGKSIKSGVDLGVRTTFGDIAATISEILKVDNTGLGTSFYKILRRDLQMFNILDIIKKKRDGSSLSKEEFDYWVNEYVVGNIPDYQISALLMAIFINGLNNEETCYLTNAMRYSGDTIDLSEIVGTKVDKHSTGGVGDKTTLVVAPIVAACGVPVAKMSGRGLGFSGGTIDKLESIPGFRTSLEANEFIEQVNKIGIAVIGQTAHIAPADKKIYALRDVTSTVDNFGLIASSIMSKKLAAGSDAIVLDVKCGSGAFMKTEEDARHLAQIMVDIGNSAGKKTIACITNMDQPLGKAIGNSIEVFEAIETLKCRGPEDFTKLVKGISGIMLYLGGAANSLDDGRILAERALESGAALEKFREFIAAQGGDPDVVDDYSLLPKAQYVAQIAAHKSGFISEIDTEIVGIASQRSGAGRLEKGESIDLSAGIYFDKKVRDYAKKDDIICTVFGDNKDKVTNAARLLKQAVKISNNCPEEIPIIKEIIGF